MLNREAQRGRFFSMAHYFFSSFPQCVFALSTSPFFGVCIFFFSIYPPFLLTKHREAWHLFQTLFVTTQNFLCSQAWFFLSTSAVIAVFSSQFYFLDDKHHKVTKKHEVRFILPTFVFFQDMCVRETHSLFAKLFPIHFLPYV